MRASCRLDHVSLHRLFAARSSASRALPAAARRELLEVHRRASSTSTRAKQHPLHRPKAAREQSKQLVGQNAAARSESLGVALCPSSRRTASGMGLVGDDGHDRQHDAPLLERTGHSPCLPTARSPQRACHRRSWTELRGRHPRHRVPRPRALSGGNVQKVLVGREIALQRQTC